MKHLNEQSRLNGGTYNTNQFSSVDGAQSESLDKMPIRDDSDSDDHKETRYKKKGRGVDIKN
jgi:hypothetical protein